MNAFICFTFSYEYVKPQMKKARHLTFKLKSKTKSQLFWLLKNKSLLGWDAWFSSLMRLHHSKCFRISTFHKNFLASIQPSIRNTNIFLITSVNTNCDLMTSLEACRANGNFCRWPSVWRSVSSFVALFTFPLRRWAQRVTHVCSFLHLVSYLVFSLLSGLRNVVPHYYAIWK